MSRPTRAPRRTALTRGAAAAVLVLLTGCAPGSPADRADSGPLAGARFYVNPDSTAQRALQEALASGRPQLAEQLSRIADQPTAVWFAGQHDVAETTAHAEQLTTTAAQQGAVPVLVLYDLPGRDCGQYSSGGADDPADYLRTVDALAGGVSDRRAVVIVEPDAIAHALQQCPGALSPEQRFELLGSAVDRLKRQPGTRVYLDAGNGGWISDQTALAGALTASGVRRADGFALNVSNFESTSTSTSYGHGLSDRLAGAHFVIDTSRNGNGPPPPGADRWCNPPDRLLGTAPTADTGAPRVDAHLWVKQPGDSDGTCRGGPPAGTWWPELAQDLLS